MTDPPDYLPETIVVTLPPAALPGGTLSSKLALAAAAASATLFSVGRQRVVRLPVAAIAVADAILCGRPGATIGFEGDGLPADVPRARLLCDAASSTPAADALADYRVRCAAWWRDRGYLLHAQAVAEDEARVAERRARAPAVLLAAVRQACKVARQDGVTDATIARILAEAAAP